MVLSRAASLVVLIFGLTTPVLAKKHNGDFGVPKPPPQHVPEKAKKIVPAPAPVPQKPPVAAPKKPVLPPSVGSGGASSNPSPINSGGQQRPVNGGMMTPDQFAREWIAALSSGRRIEIHDVNNDQELVYAVQNRRDLLYIQGANVRVIRIMPDDNSGLRHQSWYVQLSNGQEMYAVYNVDVSARVPVEVNQLMKLGGEFKWTNQGALIHWLHEDPKDRRPHGYVEVGGLRYGKVD